MNINRNRLFDFSLGPQSATSWLLRKPNELEDSRNILFNKEIGSMVGRPGITPWGDPFASPALPPQGAHTANFREGRVRMVAVNNSTATNTVVKTQNSTTGIWTNLITDLPANCQVFFLDYLNEVYISGYSSATGTPFQPRNVNASLNVSLTRNLLNCPYPHYFVEYLGLLYAVNVLIGSTRYPDRVYKSSPPTSTVTFIQGDQSGTLTTLKLDSVRYLKTGMAIDIYTKGTATKIYDITITGVNKTANTITFASAAVTVKDNDEIYLDGRFGNLNMLWNTDYPTEDKAEFLAILPGTDSSNSITAATKSNNRLFLFTENSSTRWDGQNLVTFNNSVGCISHRTLKNIDDDWMIWLDALGRVWSRNEASGDQQYISRGIYNNIMSNFTEDDFRVMHAVRYGSTYKLFLGALDGDQIRVTYDFDSNTWSPESLGVTPGLTIVDEHNGELKPIIYSTDGKGYIDELGDDDNGKAIQWMALLGRSNYGTEGRKRFHGLFVYSSNASSLKIMAATGTRQMVTQGQIQQEEQFIKFPEAGSNALPEASTVNIKIVGRYKGLPPTVEALVPYFVNREDIPQNG